MNKRNEGEIPSFFTTPTEDFIPLYSTPTSSSLIVAVVPVTFQLNVCHLNGSLINPGRRLVLVAPSNHRRD